MIKLIKILFERKTLQILMFCGKIISARVMNSANVFEAGNLVSPLFLLKKALRVDLMGIRLPVFLRKN